MRFPRCDCWNSGTTERTGCSLGALRPNVLMASREAEVNPHARSRVGRRGPGPSARLTRYVRHKAYLSGRSPLTCKAGTVRWRNHRATGLTSFSEGTTIYRPQEYHASQAVRPCPCGMWGNNGFYGVTRGQGGTTGYDWQGAGRFLRRLAGATLQGEGSWVELSGRTVMGVTLPGRVLP